MSQEKVDLHKKQKANVKKTVKKEKRNRVLRITVAVIVAAAAFGWFGYSVYENQKPIEEINVETDYTAFDNYTNGLGTTSESSETSETSESSATEESSETSVASEASETSSVSESAE